MVSHRRNAILEHSIKEFTLGIRTLILQAIRMCPEAVSTMMWTLSFKTACQRCNSLEMYKYGKNPEQKFAGVEFQNFPTYYHSWCCPIFFLEDPFQGGPAGIPNWIPRSKTGVYIEQSSFHGGLVALVLNLRTGHVYPQYHVVFDDIFSTVEHMRKGTVSGNCKTW